MPTILAQTYSHQKLIPLYQADRAQRVNVALSPNLTLALGQLLTETATLGTYTAYMPAPPAPVPTTATTGGTVAAGTYCVEVSYVNAAGESVASASGSVTTTGTTSTITVPSPASVPGATGYYAYLTQAGGSTYTRQQAAGSPTAIGTAFVLSAPPTNTGAAPSATSTAGAAKVILEYAATTDGSGNITTDGEWGATYSSISAFLPTRMAYSATDLVGLDNAALTSLGGIIAEGSLTAGTVII